MKTIVGTINGDVTIREDTNLHGLVSGSVTVANGAAVRLRARVKGDVVIGRGARVFIYERVHGSIVNEGGLVKVVDPARGVAMPRPAVFQVVLGR